MCVLKIEKKIDSPKKRKIYFSIYIFVLKFYFRNMEELRKLIGKNLSDLRKKKGLTQGELAAKFNYTDRAVSKWENGETMPDVEILYNLCDFYGVTLDYLTHEDNLAYIKTDDSMPRRITITALVSSIIWMLATVVFVIGMIRFNVVLWQSFLWAIPVNCVVASIFNFYYFRNRVVSFIFWSIFIWSLLLSVFLSVLDASLWPIFILGIPSQATLIIWFNLKKHSKQNLHK